MCGYDDIVDDLPAVNGFPREHVEDCVSRNQCPLYLSANEDARGQRDASSSACLNTDPFHCYDRLLYDVRTGQGER